MAEEIGRVAAIWRYPVKSMQGASLARATIDARGLEGDRLFAVRNAEGRFGSGKTTRRFCRMDGLLEFVARQDGDVPMILFPDGRERRGDTPSINGELSVALGQPVTLAREAAISHFDAAPVHIVTHASLGWLNERLPTSGIDARRFRPNIVLDGATAPLAEHGWIGKWLHIGGARLRLVAPTERCVMVTMAQAELSADAGILRMLARDSDACLGVYAEVVGAGSVSVGDTASLD